LAKEAQVRAAGALVAILLRDGLLSGGSTTTEEEDGTVQLADIREASFRQYLTVDPESAVALSIFVSERHSNFVVRRLLSHNYEFILLCSMSLSPPLSPPPPSTLLIGVRDKKLTNSNYPGARRRRAWQGRACPCFPFLTSA